MGMITFDQANQRVADLTAEQVRSITRQRLRGENTAPIGDGYFLEPSEDLIIQLLHPKNTQLPEEKREAVLFGCQDVYSELLGWLGKPDFDPEAQPFSGAFFRLSRVVDMTAPAELQRYANSVLDLILDNQNIPDGFLQAAVRACMGYEQAKDRISFWKKVIEYPSVAAYAFNALLSIDPNFPDIEETLKSLLRKQACEDWPIDTPFLIRRTSRVRKDPELINRILDQLYKEENGNWCWASIERVLQKQAWSSAWLNDFRSKLTRSQYSLVEQQLEQLTSMLYNICFKLQNVRIGRGNVKPTFLNRPQQENASHLFGRIPGYESEQTLLSRDSDHAKPIWKEDIISSSSRNRSRRLGTTTEKRETVFA